MSNAIINRQLMVLCLHQYAQHAKILRDRDAFAIGDLDAGRLVQLQGRRFLIGTGYINPALLYPTDVGFADTTAYSRQFVGYHTLGCKFRSIGIYSYGLFDHEDFVGSFYCTTSLTRNTELTI